MNSTPIQNGSIVALKSHPYSNNINEIIISGEHHLLPPLMVVVEILLPQNTRRNKNQDSALAKNPQCKCVWYSHKTQQFEEAWISMLLLKPILEMESLLEADINIGVRVVFKTLPLESGKKKSSLAFEDLNDRHKISTNITSLLSFVSPIMLIIGTKEVEYEESRHEKQSGVRNRTLSKLLVKCVWFNPGSDKVSEKYIPIEALVAVPSITDDLLESIKNWINTSTYLKLTVKNGTYSTESIIHPSSISYRDGFYYLKYFDLILNTSKELLINEKNDLQEIREPVKEKAPDFNLSKSLVPMKSVVDAIEVAKGRGSYIRILYKNRNDKFSIRTLSEYAIIRVAVDDKDIFYLNGFCHLRNEIRNFKVDRIDSMEELDLKFITVSKSE